MDRNSLFKHLFALAQIPGSFKGSGRVAVRLSEAGPRLKLLLVKAEEGVCTGGAAKKSVKIQ